jgi:hypothetical protein
MVIQLPSVSHGCTYGNNFLVCRDRAVRWSRYRNHPMHTKNTFYYNERVVSTSTCVEQHLYLELSPQQPRSAVGCTVQYTSCSFCVPGCVTTMTAPSYVRHYDYKCRQLPEPTTMEPSDPMNDGSSSDHSKSWDTCCFGSSFFWTLHSYRYSVGRPSVLLSRCGRSVLDPILPRGNETDMCPPAY